MPFKAIDVDTQKAVLSFWFDESAVLRAKHPNLVCPCCGEPVSARGGKSKHVVTHIFHKPKEGTKCPVALKYKNRSSLVHHTLMVDAVRKYLEKTTPEGFVLDVDHYSSELPERIPDIAVLDSDGSIVEAHEIQLTKVTTAELDERTQSYDDAGIECVWWFGKGCQTEDVIVWAKRNFGYCLLPDNSFFAQEDELRGFAA